MTFSESLLELRKERGLKRQELADALNISLRAYQYYERGEREPLLSLAVRMADFFGVSLDELACRER